MSDSSFNLHQQLAADCHVLGRFELCRLLLHRNAVVTWFILVPETTVTDLFELSMDEQRLAAEEVAQIVAFLRAECQATKLNYGSIGNVVSQLHLHVVSRTEDDPCWPAPVWGNLTEVDEYSSARVDEIRASLVKRYGMHGNAL